MSKKLKVFGPFPSLNVCVYLSISQATPDPASIEALGGQGAVPANSDISFSMTITNVQDEPVELSEMIIIIPFDTSSVILPNGVSTGTDLESFIVFCW